MIEVACEQGANCNIDQQTFKAYLSRWMAASVKVAPWTHDKIMPLIRQSALAAAKSVCYCPHNLPKRQYFDMKLIVFSLVYWR